MSKVIFIHIPKLIYITDVAKKKDSLKLGHTTFGIFDQKMQLRRKRKAQYSTKSSRSAEITEILS